MEKKKLSNLSGILGLAIFALAAMSSSSSKEVFDKDAFDRGWEAGEAIGRSLRSDVEAEPIAVDSAAIQEMPEVALAE